MAIGWERGFVVERDNTLRKRINCSDCIFYVDDDKSCGKVSNYIPNLGYDYWKQCKFFVADIDLDEMKKYKVYTVKGASGLYRRRESTVNDIMDVSTGGSYYFFNMKEEYLFAFYNWFCKNKVSDIVKCYELLPLEIYEGYVEFISTGNKEMLISAIGLFMKNLEMPLLKKGINKIVKTMMQEVFERLISAGVGLTREKFEIVFLDSFCNYMNERNAFQKYMQVNKTK